MKTVNKIFFKELIRLILYVILGSIVLGVLAMLCFIPLFLATDFDIQDMTSKAYMVHVLMWGQSIFLMFLPAYFWCKRRLRRNPFECFGFKSVDYRWLLISFSFTICSMGGFDFINTFINNFQYPAAIQESVNVSKMENFEMAQMMMNLPGVSGWIECILLVSIVTGIVEETMFRGAVLKCFGFSSLNQHWIAICVGLIFSLMHGEFLGALDRFLFGMIACYMVFWSGSIWPSIIMHAMNNLLCIVQTKLSDITDPLEPMPYMLPWYGTIIAIIASVLLLRAMYQMRIRTELSYQVKSPLA